MPSLRHEVLVELFRNRPDMVCELLAVLAGIDVRSERVELGSVDLSQVVSVEYRADAVVLMRDREEVLQGAVVVEVQLQSDPDKRLSWPQYVTGLRARLGRPVLLVVVTDDAAVARWAREPIEIGHPAFTLTPIVIELVDVPRITDSADAGAMPELAVLSALAHPEPEVARAAVMAISRLPEERSRLYLDLVLRALGALADEVQMIKNYEYQSDFARKYYGQGLDEGREEGREEGLRELRAIASNIVKLRAPAIAGQLEERIGAVREPSQLRVLIDRLMSSTTESEVLACLEQLGER